LLNHDYDYHDNCIIFLLVTLKKKKTNPNAEQSIIRQQVYRHSGVIFVTDLWFELVKLCSDIWSEATLHQS